MSVSQMTAREIYESYAAQADPNDLIAKGRAAIASHLMVGEGLDEASAFYAADMILNHALQLLNCGPQKVS